MNNKIKNKEIEKVLKTAENYMKEEKFTTAFFCYEKIFDFQNESYYHKAYFGLYLSWWNYSKSINTWSLAIDDFFNNAILTAPLDKQEEYHKIYNENNKIFHKEDLEDEQ